MKPVSSYIIWFSQRVGSTVLCRALTETGVAGMPDELLYQGDNCDLLSMYHANNYAEAQKAIWKRGTTPNGVFGMKVGMVEPHNTRMTEQFRLFPGCGGRGSSRAEAWENAFPRCRHIHMTRRNRVRLAVSWWKAIRTGEFHRLPGESAGRTLKSSDYDFNAIKRLMLDADMRESSIQQFLSEAGITPLVVVYEDFIAGHRKTIRRILNYLDIPEADTVSIPELSLQKLADHQSEEWVQRFREELQKDWQYRAW